MKKAFIVVAGGSGSRMQSEIPKQFIEWCGKPILMHTIERLHNYNPTAIIVLVLPKSQLPFWKELCNQHNFSIEVKIAQGGSTRYESVKNGLNKINEECLVAIHDGVRPLVTNQTLNNCFNTAERTGSAIPVTDAIESIRKTENNQSIAVPRDQYKMVQTPQVFKYTEILKAYKQPYQEIFTDDASVFEYAGNSISLTEGNRENIKITTPIDLAIGETLFNLLSE